METRYYLKNTETDYVESMIEVEKHNRCHADLICYQATAWGIDTKTPMDYMFLASAYCKWDSCTHWYFYGEDYIPGDDASDKDSYYHLCGSRSFIDHIRAMCFMWKIACEIIGDRAEDNYFASNLCKETVEFMLKGYEILKEVALV